MILGGVAVSKTKILIPILIILVLIVGGVLLYNYSNSNKSNDEPNQDAQSVATNTDTSSQSTSSESSASSTSSESKTTDNSVTQAKLESFTEGVWIKKYPENYACFKFETPEGLKVVADPYMMNETVEPDIVTESHQHSDHTDTSKLQGKYKLINQTGNFEEKGIKITGYSGQHNKGDTSETNIVYTYEINGIKIAHFASQGEMLADNVLEKMKDVDVLLIQGSIKPEYADSKLNLSEMKYIIDKLKPKIVIPEHGSENLGKALASYLNLNVEFIKGGQIVVTRKDLDTAKSLRVLDIDTDVPKN